MTTLHQRGFSHIIVSLAVVVVAVTAFAGYRVMHASTNTASSEASTTSSKVPKTIHSTADVRKASQALDQTSTDAVNPNQLDNDLNSLL